MMTVIVDPRQAAQAHYLLRYDDLATTAQLNIGTEYGNKIAHDAERALHAADTERDNPDPSVALDCRCLECRWYRLFADKSVPAMECVS